MIGTEALQPHARIPPERFLSAANLASLVRIPLAAIPWLYPDNVPVILTTVALAAFSDGLDGFLARLHDRALFREPARRIGVWLDPVCDKIFVISTILAVWVSFAPPVWLVPAVLSRELILGTYALIRRLLPGAAPAPVRAAVIGKITTGAQFATLIALVLEHAAAPLLAGATGLLGTAAALHYIGRARTAARREPA